MGTNVTVSSDTPCGAPRDEPTLVFLGPAAHIGSSGGGNPVPYRKVGAGFTAIYRIPSTYTSGGNVNRPIRVTPGSNYSFATYPAGLCGAPFTVTP